MSNTSVDWNKILQHAAATDVGMRRSNNQDSHAVVMAGDVEHWYLRGHMFIVADGMGAHAAGELASKLAVDGIPHLYHKHHELSPPEALQRAITETNSEVHRRGEANPDFQHMGTTSSVLVILPQGALVAHIGDSRCYRLRGDTLRQLTFDHSLVWEMRASGELPAGDDAKARIPKNVITRSLGPNARVKTDFEGPFPVQVGDTFLLCSDGLTARVEDEEIGAFMRSLPPAEAAQTLIDLTNLRGGPDNTTIIIVRVIDPQITTSMTQAQPLVLNAENEDKRDAHPATWVITGVLLLAAVVMGVMGNSMLALAAGCAGLIAGTFGILQKYGSISFGRSKEVALSDGRRLGAGPYTETHVPQGQQLIDQLSVPVDRLCQAGHQRGRDLDWPHVEAEKQAAAAAASSGDFAAAAGRLAGIIRHMMQQVRQKQKAAASDSKIEL